MTESFHTFRVFSSQGKAYDMAGLLGQFGIPCTVKEEVEILIIAQGIEEQQTDYRLELRRHDFDTADKILEELPKPSTVHRNSINYMYFLAFLVFPLGIFIGWIWKSSKRTLPGGIRIYQYDRNTREHGAIIMGIGFGMMIYAILSELLSRIF